jgi:hypothetical protein
VGPNLATRQQEKVETIYILERHELDLQRLKLIADKASFIILSKYRGTSVFIN